MSIANFKEFLKENTPKKTKKIYDVIKKEPSERKKDTSPNQYKGVKDELVNHIHKQNIYRMKELMRKYDLPKALIAKFKKDMVPLNKIPEETNKKYARKLSALYAIFKKYIEVRKSIQKKTEEEDIKQFPLGTIKSLISQGKNLEEVAEYFNVPKSTLSYKIKTLYQTTFSNLKKQVNK